MIGVGMLIGGGPDALLVHSATFTGTGSAQDVGFGGAIAGDLVFVYVQPSATDPVFAAAGGAAWTALEPFGVGVHDPYGYRSRIAFKVLNGTDITNADVRVTLENGQPGWIAVYRGPTTAAIVQSQICSPETATTLALGGVTISANVAAVLIMTSDRDTASAVISPPSNAGGLASRVNDFGAGFFRINAWDYLAPADYPEQSLTFTGFTGVLYQWGHIVELRK